MSVGNLIKLLNEFFLELDVGIGYGVYVRFKVEVYVSGDRVFC